MATSSILGECAKSFFTKPLTLNRVEQFLEADPSCVRRFDNMQQTPLLLVLKNETCSVNIVQLLLQYGSDINHRDFWEDNSLFVALYHRQDEEIIGVLLGNRVDSVFRNNMNQSPLCIAVHREASLGVIKLLLGSTRFSRRCLNHGSLLHCVLDCSSRPITEDLLDVLIDAGEDLNSRDSKDRSVLCLATRSGIDAQELQLLLSRGGSLSACYRHDSPMMCATDGAESSSYLRADVVQLLLEKEAEMDTRARRGAALSNALLQMDYNINVIELLVDHESFDVNARHGMYGNLLQLAVRNPCCTASVLQLLIDKGVRVVENDSRWMDGRSIMEVAMATGLDHCALKLLFAHGAKIDQRMEHHKSLLEFTYLQYVENPTEENLDLYLLMLKWYCLQNLNRDLGLNAIDHWEFLRFAADCSIELGRMRLHNVDCSRTLQDYAGKGSSSADDVHEVVRILSKNTFPIYFDTIVAKVGRKSLETKLLAEVPVYAIKNCTTSGGTKRCKVVLDFVTLSNITQRLSDEELMQLILAYFMIR